MLSCDAFLLKDKRRCREFYVFCYCLICVLFVAVWLFENVRMVFKDILIIWMFFFFFFFFLSMKRDFQNKEDVTIIIIM